MLAAKTQSQCSDLSQHISQKIADFFFFVASDSESFQPEDQTCLLFLSNSCFCASLLFRMTWKSGSVAYSQLMHVQILILKDND